MRNYKAYIFDFDYTLANSERAILMCFRLTLEHAATAESVDSAMKARINDKINSISDEQIKLTIGHTLEEAFGTLIGEFDKTNLLLLRKIYVKYADIHMSANTLLYENVIPLLEGLKYANNLINPSTKQKYTPPPSLIGIVSTKYRYRILQTLEKHNIVNLVDLIIGGEDVSNHKPSPDGINLWLKSAGIDKADAVYIGDHTVDALAAKSAQVDFIALTQGNTNKETFNDYPHIAIFDSITDFCNLLNQS